MEPNKCLLKAKIKIQLFSISVLQPVYTDDPNEEDEYVDYKSTRRSSSCPNLSIHHEQTPQYPRKRAKSVFHPADTDLMRATHLDRVHSESDLSRIDRKRTFDESNSITRPNDILAQVVTALGAINISSEDEDYETDEELGGIHGFSDSQILASEKIDSRWSLAYSDGSANAIPPAKERGRAASDFIQPVHLYDNDEHKWTWSGNNSQIKEFMRMRKLKNPKQNNLYRASFAVPPKPSLNGNSITINVTGPDGLDENATYNSRSVWDKFNPFKKRSLDERKMSASPDQLDVQRYLERTGAGRNTRKSISASPKQYTRRMSLFPDQSEVQRYLDRTGAGRNTRKSLSARSYLTASSKGRPSIASGLTTTDEATEDILENTTIADLIRALEVAHTKANTLDTPLLQDYFDVPKRKMGTASPPTTLPPVLGLFSVSPPTFEHGRRGSMRPPTTQTPVLSRLNMGRRQSNVLDLLGQSQRRMSLKAPPSLHPEPPPYTPTPILRHRRFSVRPTNLSTPPGQAPPSFHIPSKQQSSGVQRKLSMVPSPLARDTAHAGAHLRSSVRFARSPSSNPSSGNATPTFTSPAQLRGSILRSSTHQPSSAFQTRRHGSMAHIYQRSLSSDRNRTESR